MTTPFLLAVAAALPLQGAEEGPAAGVTLKENRDLADRIQDVTTLLGAKRTEPAIALLNQVLESDPQALVPTSDPTLRRGARAQALHIASNLKGEEAIAHEEWALRRGMPWLDNALNPPNETQLHRLAIQWQGTSVGKKAASILLDTLLDHGQFEQAKELVRLGGEIPPRWASLPQPPWRTPFLLPTIATLNDSELPQVDTQNLKEAWRFDFSDPPTPGWSRAHRALIANGNVFLTDGMETVALELGTGRVLWRRAPHHGWANMPGDDRNRLLAGIDSDFLSVPILEDGILLVLQLEPIPLGRSEAHARIDIRRFLPARRLYALDAQTGEMRWRVETNWEGDKAPRNLAAAPPAAAAGRVFLPVYDAVGTLDLSLAAFDLKTGQPLWKSFAVTGQKESNLFGNVLVELASGIPAADAEAVIFCTNLGTINAFHASTGMALWTRLYTRTPVRLFQTGKEALRPETFSHGPPAFDGKRFACAPIDGLAAIALETKSGKILANWEVLDEAGTLRSLLGFGPLGAWFTGTRACFLGTDDYPSIFSPALHDLYSRPEQQHAGALIRGGFLAPTARAVESLDPRDFRPLGKILSWDLGVESGPVQAAPGTILIMRPTGVTALRSPGTLLSTFLEETSGSKNLIDILALLEQVPIVPGNQLTVSAATHAENLARNTQNSFLATRLALFASKAWLAADKGNESLRILAPLLQGPWKDQAALVIADYLVPTASNAPFLSQAKKILGENPKHLVKRSNGKKESYGLIAAQLGAVSAHASGNENKELNALLELLARNDFISSPPNSSETELWAVNRLEQLASKPKHAAAIDIAVKESGESAPWSASWVRRFGSTQKGRAELEAFLLTPTNSRADRIRIARWLRKYTDQPPNLPPDFRMTPEVPRLPNSLHLIHKVAVDGNRLLAASSTQNGVLALLQDEENVQFVELGAEGANPVFSKKTKVGKIATSSLKRRVWLENRTATILTPHHWMQLRPDGWQKTELLPKNQAIPIQPLRMGDFLVFPTSEENRSIEMRDITTGETLFSEPLEATANHFLHLISKGNSVLVLEEKHPAVRTFSYSETQPTSWPLPIAPLTYEMESALSWKEGLAIPRKGARFTTLIFTGPAIKSPEGFPQPPLVGVQTFSAPGGVGWLITPLLPGQSEIDNPRILWRSEESEDIELLNIPANSHVPQVDSFSRLDHHLETPTVLSFAGDSSGGTIFRAISLASSPAFMWQSGVKDIAFAQLAAHQPKPLNGENGWAVPLIEKPNVPNSVGVQILLLDEAGTLVERFRTSSFSQAHFEMLAVGKFLILQVGPNLYLLGNE